MLTKKTLLLGASNNPERYSFKALTSLSSHGVPAVAWGRRSYMHGDIEVLDSWDDDKFRDIHTVTLYLSAQNQEPLIEHVLGLRPERVIFNPGTENPGLELLMREEGLHYVHACTLVLLATGQY